MSEVDNNDKKEGKKIEKKRENEYFKSDHHLMSKNCH